ncbi:hypothetical protein GOQ04_03215 [Emticicia sp. ODNR4P]|nr:hypothetical protein [Emticicia sp. ODNR4P]
MTTSKILRIAFNKWFESYFQGDNRIDTYVNLATARGAFYSCSGMSITPIAFRDTLKLYCKTNKLFFNPKNAKGYDKDTKRILQQEKGRITEYIYIAKTNSVILQKISFQVLVDYPGSNFQVGEIIEVIEGKFTKKLVDVECSWDLEYFLKYPNIFKEL